jgi:hypothetical protein
MANSPLADPLSVAHVGARSVSSADPATRRSRGPPCIAGSLSLGRSRLKYPPQSANSARVRPFGCQIGCQTGWMPKPTVLGAEDRGFARPFFDFQDVLRLNVCTSRADRMLARRRWKCRDDDPFLFEVGECV